MTYWDGTVETATNQPLRVTPGQIRVPFFVGAPLCGPPLPLQRRAHPVNMPLCPCRSVVADLKKNPRQVELMRHALSTFLPSSVISPFVRALPVLVIVVLSAPAWLTWPFLSEVRQRAVLEMVEALARWTRGDARAIEEKKTSPRCSKCLHEYQRQPRRPIPP